MTEYAAMCVSTDPAVGEGLRGRTAGLKAMHARDIGEYCQVVV